MAMRTHFATPRIISTGINAKTGDHPLTHIMGVLGVHHTPIAADTVAQSYLQNNAQILCTQEGFRDPAAMLFEVPDGEIKFVVFDVEKPKGRAEAKALIPAGAKINNSLIFTPHGSVRDVTLQDTPDLSP